MPNLAVATTSNFDNSINWGLQSSDILTISGVVLTLNSDNIWAQNNAAWSNVVLSSVNGGTAFIDGTTVRWLQYSSGAGTVPPSISGYQYPYPSGVIGGTSLVSGEYLGVWSSIPGAPVAGGSAMPSTGYVKMRSATGSFINGETITLPGGATGTAVGADTVGWLVVYCSGQSTLTVPRLGSFIVSGAWFELGVSNGTANQIFNYYATDYCPAVWVETASGSNSYDIWCNYACDWSINNSGIGYSGVMGRFFNNTTSQIIFGSGVQNRPGGIPVAGARIRVPNIHIANVDSTTNWLTPSLNTTLTNRWETLTTDAGVIRMDKCNTNMYINASQAYQVDLRNCGIMNAVNLSEIGSPIYFSGIGFGQAVIPAATAPAITLGTCQAGGWFENCNMSNSFTATGSTAIYVVSVTLCNNITFKNCISSFKQATTSTARNTYFFTTTDTVLMSGCYSMNGRVLLTTANNVNIYNTYIGDLSPSTTMPQRTTGGLDHFLFNGFSTNILVDTVQLVPGYSTMMATTTVDLFELTQVNNVTIRNIGTLANQFLGRGRLGYCIDATASVVDLTIQRVYASGLAASSTAFLLTNNANDRHTFENCGSDTENPTLAISKNTVYKGMVTLGGTHGGANQAVYGTHFYDMFVGGTTARTSGYIGLVFNEKTITEPSASAYTTSGTVKFTSTGSLKLVNIGDSITYEWPYYILGYSGLYGVAATKTGTNTANISGAIAIDRNDGNGFSSFLPDSAANLATYTGISPTLGFKPKIKLTCITANALNALTYYYFFGQTNQTLQETCLYPLETVQTSLSLTNLQVNSEVRIYSAGTITELDGIESSSTSFTYDYTWTGTDILVDIVIHHQDYQYIRYTNISLGSTGLSIPIQQVFDRNYSNL